MAMADTEKTRMVTITTPDMDGTWTLHIYGEAELKSATEEISGKTWTMLDILDRCAYAAHKEMDRKQAFDALDAWHGVGATDPRNTFERSELRQKAELGEDEVIVAHRRLRCSFARIKVDVEDMIRHCITDMAAPTIMRTRVGPTKFSGYMKPEFRAMAASAAESGTMTPAFRDALKEMGEQPEALYGRVEPIRYRDVPPGYAHVEHAMEIFGYEGRWVKTYGVVFYTDPEYTNAYASLEIMDQTDHSMFRFLYPEDYEPTSVYLRGNLCKPEDLETGERRHLFAECASVDDQMFIVRHKEIPNFHIVSEFQTGNSTDRRLAHTTYRACRKYMF